MASQTYPRETAGAGFLVTGAALLATILVIAGLIYATGTNARHLAGLAAAGCEPSESPSGLPCTTKQMIASRYTAITDPANRELAADMAAYSATEARHLSAATMALSSEVETEQAFDRALAAAIYTPTHIATAVALTQDADAHGNPPPLDAAVFTPQISVIANTLIRANQALIKVTSEQARSTSLRQLHSLNHARNTAQATAEAQATLIRKALGLPSHP